MRARIRYLLLFGLSLAAITLFASEAASGQIHVLQVDVNGLVIHDGGPGDGDGRHNDSIAFHAVIGGFDESGVVFSQRGAYIAPWTYVEVGFDLSITALTDQADGYFCVSDRVFPVLTDLEGREGITGLFIDNAADDADALIYQGFLGPDRCSVEGIGDPMTFDDKVDLAFSDFAFAFPSSPEPFFLSGRVDFHASSAGDGVVAHGGALVRGLPEPSSAALVTLGSLFLIGRLNRSGLARLLRLLVHPQSHHESPLKQLSVPEPRHSASHGVLFARMMAFGPFRPSQVTRHGDRPSKKRA